MASPQQRRAARRASGEPSTPSRKAPITADRITDAALEIVASRGMTR